MIHVVLDTAILRKRPNLDSPEFKALRLLSKNGCVTVHLPYFVEREFATFLRDDFDQKILSLVTSLLKLLAYEGHGKHTESLSTMSSGIRSTVEAIPRERVEAFEKWMNDLDVQRYSLDGHQTAAALDAYFDGNLPLKTPKTRKDIPDSFIFQAIIDLHEKHDVHVVVEDNALSEACSNTGVQVHSSLSDFVELGENRKCLQGKLGDDELKILEAYLAEYLASKNEELLDLLEQELLKDSYRLIQGESIPSESGDIYVSGVDRPESVTINDIEYYGQGDFMVYLSGRVELTYECAIFKSDAFDLDPKKYFVEYLNNHYFNVETVDTFTFDGLVSVALDLPENIGTVAQLLQAISTPTLRVEELDDFEIST